MNAKAKAVTQRIRSLEKAITKAREHLESGKHANWRAFRPLFSGKIKDGKTLPPHPDWVKNFFLPRKERALKYAEKVLVTLERKKHERAVDE